MHPKVPAPKPASNPNKAPGTAPIPGTVTAPAPEPITSPAPAVGTPKAAAKKASDDAAASKKASDDAAAVAKKASDDAAASKRSSDEAAAKKASDDAKKAKVKTAEELFAEGEAAASSRSAKAVFREAAEKFGHGPSQKRLWEIFKAENNPTEAVKWQRLAFQNMVAGVPEPVDAVKLK